MSPRDPRLFDLISRAVQWDQSLEWIEEPDPILLEIIPPTVERAAAGGGRAPRANARGPDAAARCDALAYLARVLRASLGRSHAKEEPATA